MCICIILSSVCGIDFKLGRKGIEVYAIRRTANYQMFYPKRND